MGDVQASGGPDWTVVITLGLAVLGAAGGAIVWLSGAFRQSKTDEETRQEKRDTAAAANADRTLDGVFSLVEQLQAERKHLAEQMEASERRCTSRIETLEGKVAALEAAKVLLELALLGANNKVIDLEREIRELRAR